MQFNFLTDAEQNTSTCKVKSQDCRDFAILPLKYLLEVFDLQFNLNRQKW